MIEYNNKSMNDAKKIIEEFRSNLGGTEIFEPLE
jgi:hypothetical protein